MPCCGYFSVLIMEGRQITRTTSEPATLGADNRMAPALFPAGLFVSFCFLSVRLPGRPGPRRGWRGRYVARRRVSADYLGDRVVRPPHRPQPVGNGPEVRLEDGLQHELQRRLDDPV